VLLVASSSSTYSVGVSFGIGPAAARLLELSLLCSGVCERGNAAGVMMERDCAVAATTVVRARVGSGCGVMLKGTYCRPSMQALL
jgi:hypothetical protein